jgi:5-methyltetrahydropteroyltriglutamate--homocysteine methyltransferase
VLTTHTGSLPRPDDLAKLHIARQEGEEVNSAEFEQHVASAVDEVVARLTEIGVDVVSDGEMSKAGYIDYTRDRLTGLTGGEGQPDFYLTDLVEVPELVAAAYKDTHLKFHTCEAPVSFIGAEQVARDTRNFRAALKRHPATEGFIPSSSPGNIAMTCPNNYYGTHDEYLFALADAMNVEYRAITDAGFLVQVDAPELAYCSDLHTWMWPEIEKRGVRNMQERYVEAINRALDGIPAEKARLHLCWANYMGPHTHDQPLRDVLEPALRANVAAINFEAANPAHAHEWALFEDFKVPDDKVMIPGVIDTKTQVVEHPRLVAQRISQFLNLLGREQVMAGTDCGFGTFVGLGSVHPKIAWLKLKSLVDGAAIASQRPRG